MRQRLRALAGLVAALVTVSSCSSPQGSSEPGPSSAATVEVTSRVLDLRDPARPTGPYPGVPEQDGRALPTTLWYPATGDGPFPLVVFSHGFGSTPEAYAELLESWASQGFVVAAPAFPLTSEGSPMVVDDVRSQPADISFVIGAVAALGDAGEDDLAGRVDPSHVLAAGHSLGASTTLGLITPLARDPRVTAAMVFAVPVEGFGTVLADPPVPLLIIHAVDDNVVAFADGEALYAGATGPKAFLQLLGGGHSAPYDSPRDARHPLVDEVSSEFLRFSTGGDEAALADLRTSVEDSNALARWSAQGL
ncbi:alpha/beta hydrolase family protein [Blastococcus sp. SYSU D00695]